MIFQLSMNSAYLYILSRSAFPIKTHISFWPAATSPKFLYILQFVLSDQLRFEITSHPMFHPSLDLLHT